MSLFGALVSPIIHLSMMPYALASDMMTNRNIVSTTFTQPHSQEARIPLGDPVRIRIPKINVDASFELVGMTSDGAMEAPKNNNNVAWFNLGPRPGDIGSAVIAGHYGLSNGKPSVFDELYLLRKGDEIVIENDRGEETVFIVQRNRRYTPTEDAVNVFQSNDGGSHLNLITCEGKWDVPSKSYSKRLVVFADRK